MTKQKGERKKKKKERENMRSGGEHRDEDNGMRRFATVSSSTSPRKRSDGMRHSRRSSGSSGSRGDHSGAGAAGSSSTGAYILCHVACVYSFACV